jgi:hypothetical protein
MDIREMIKQELAWRNYYSTVPAVIDGKVCHLTEPEVIALQVICAKIYKNEGPRAWRRFCQRVTIFNGPADLASETMKFRRDGAFENEFLPGFYDITGRMALEIL